MMCYEVGSCVSGLVGNMTWFQALRNVRFSVLWDL